MDEADLIQKQRIIVRDLRHSTAQRIDGREQADEFRQRKLSESEAEFKQKSIKATSKLNRARQSLSDVRKTLTGIGLKSFLDKGKTPSTSSLIITSNNPDDDLEKWVLAASEAAEAIVADSNGVQEWRTYEQWPLLRGYMEWYERLSDNEKVASLLLIPIVLVMAIFDIIYRIVMAVKKWNESPYEENLVQTIESCVPILLQAVHEGEASYKGVMSKLTKEHEQRNETTESEYNTVIEKLVPVYEKIWNQVEEKNRAIIEESGVGGLPWDDLMWSSWNPPLNKVTSTHLRIGEIVEQRKWDTLTLPALLPVVGGKNIIIKCNRKVSQDAALTVRCLVLRLLATIPPGKVRFILVDPLGLGKNISTFMRLADYDEELVGSWIWTEPRDIEDQLKLITEHMEFVFQRYLQDKYATIEDYNLEAGEVAEPYKILVIVNYPVNFTESAINRLVSIAQNGPSCGVYTIISLLVDDIEKAESYKRASYKVEDLERSANIVEHDGNHFFLNDDVLKDCFLRLDKWTSTELVDSVFEKIGALAKEAKRVEVPFVKIAGVNLNWWDTDSSKGLSIPVGRAGARKLQTIELGHGTSQHILIAGKTGSGKSTLLHAIIISIGIRYSPDEVQMYLIDFKKGVEFKTYAVHNMPHAPVVAIETEREFGLSVLKGINNEFNRRGELFRSVGVDHISDYRSETGKPMSRILLIVDEFQEFFTENDHIATEAGKIFHRLVSQARAFGIHILLASQTLGGAYALARSTMDQMAVRIALQCSEADSRLILAEDNPAARLLTRPGEAIYNAANGMKEGNTIFQVAWLPDEDRDAYLGKIRCMSSEKGFTSAFTQIVFEGNAPAEVTKNYVLQSLLEAGDWPSFNPKVTAWLGEPIAIKEPTAGYFRRLNGSNLIIIGQDDNASCGMLLVTLAGLAAQHRPNEATFFIVNLKPDADYSNLFSVFKNSIPNNMQLAGRRDLTELINQIYTIVNERLSMQSDDVTHWKEGTIYLVLFGLQRARDLREDEDFSYSYSEETQKEKPSKQLITILEEGPELDVHTLAWCDSYSNLVRLNRRILRNFEMRVALQMSTEDSNNFIDSPSASKLGPHRALYVNADEGIMEKFRPYYPPTEEWIKWAGEMLNKKTV